MPSEEAETGLRRAIPAVAWVLALAVGTGLALLIAAIVTWPLPTCIGSCLPFGDEDMDTHVGGFWWPLAFVRAIRSGDPIFFRPELYWPYGQDTRLFIWNFGTQLLLAPFIAGDSPLEAVGVAALWVLTTNGLAAAWVGWSASKRPVGAFCGLVVGASSIFAFSEASLGRMDQGFWAPIAVYLVGWMRLVERPGDRGGRAIAIVALAVAGACYWFHGYFLAVVTAMMAAFAFVRGRLAATSRRDLLWVAVGSLILVLPALVPILDALASSRSVHGAIEANNATPEFRQASSLAFPGSFGGPFPDVLWGGVTTRRLPVLCLPLCAVAALRGKAAVRMAGVAGLVGLAFTLGPRLVWGYEHPAGVRELPIPLPFAALDLLPGMETLRWPYRWQAIALPAMAAAGAWVVSRIRWSPVIALAFAAWQIAEFRIGLDRFTPQRDPVVQAVAVPEVLVALSRMGGVRPVLQLPYDGTGNSKVRWASFHLQPIDAGLGWQWEGTRPAAAVARLHRVPLFVMARVALEAADAAAGGHGWRLDRAAFLDRFPKRFEAALDRARDAGDAVGRWEGLRCDAVDPTRSLNDETQAWTEEETGGFHYVLLAHDASSSAQMEGREVALSCLFGRPFHSENRLVVWAIPGVGELPPGYALLPAFLGPG